MMVNMSALPVSVTVSTDSPTGMPASRNDVVGGRPKPMRSSEVGLRAAGVHRDRKAEALRRVVFGAPDVFRHRIGGLVAAVAAPRHAQRDQAIIAMLRPFGL